LFTLAIDAYTRRGEREDEMFTFQEILIVSLFNWISAGCGIIAATYWVRSASVSTRYDFSGFPREPVGFAGPAALSKLSDKSTPIGDLAEVIKEQSRLNKKAAAFAAAAAVSGSAAMLLFPYFWNY
jgi:hypothetical protein